MEILNNVKPNPLDGLLTYKITTEEEWYQAVEHKKFLEEQISMQFNQVDGEQLWLITDAMDKYIQCRGNK
jgi:hypothetical protein